MDFDFENTDLGKEAELEKSARLDVLALLRTGEREMMELHFLELPKYQETNSVPHSTLEKWMLFFKTQNDKMLEELQMTDKSFDKAVSALEVAQMTAPERRAYEARLAFITDQLSALEYAKKSGLKEGMEKGIEKGMEKGAHMFRLQYLTKQAKKRFPGLSDETQSKIFMLSDQHLEQQLELILDYQSKQEFENAIAALPATATK